LRLKIKSEENGSALIFTILILFILSVLGSVLISVGMSNFKLIRHGNDYNTAYYLADGAAEEVVSEIDIITQNAEYESLSHTSEYAEGHKGNSDYVEEEEKDDDGKDKKDKDKDETTYVYDEDKFKSDLEEEFQNTYKSEVAANLVDACETVEFNPVFGNNFDEGKPTVEVTVPGSLFSGNISNDIVVEIVGRYNNMERKVKLTFNIYVPSYEFKTSSDPTNIADYIYYKGYERNASPVVNFSYKWEETNIN